MVAACISKKGTKQLVENNQIPLTLLVSWDMFISLLVSFNIQLGHFRRIHEASPNTVLPLGELTAPHWSTKLLSCLVLIHLCVESLSKETASQTWK